MISPKQRDKANTEFSRPLTLVEQRIPPSIQTRASNFAAHHWMMQANEVFLKVRTVVLWLEKLVSGVIWEAVEERAVFWSGTGQSGEADRQRKKFSTTHRCFLLERDDLCSS